MTLRRVIGIEARSPTRRVPVLAVDDAPVVMRFMAHAVALPAAVQVHADAVWGLPAVRQWMTAARAETGFIAAHEPYATWIFPLGC